MNLYNDHLQGHQPRLPGLLDVTIDRQGMNEVMQQIDGLRCSRAG